MVTLSFVRIRGVGVSVYVQGEELAVLCKDVYRVVVCARRGKRSIFVPFNPDHLVDRTIQVDIREIPRRKKRTEEPAFLHLPTKQLFLSESVLGDQFCDLEVRKPDDHDWLVFQASASLLGKKTDTVICSCWLQLSQMQEAYSQAVEELKKAATLQQYDECAARAREALCTIQAYKDKFAAYSVEDFLSGVDLFEFSPGPLDAR